MVEGDGHDHGSRSTRGVFRYIDLVDVRFWGRAHRRPTARPDDPARYPAPFVVLLSITIAAVVVAQDWQKIHLRTTGWLLAPTFLGIPLGIALLTRVDPHIVKAALAIVIVGFSGYSLLVNKPPALSRDSHLWMVVCGFFAGVLGGAYRMNGPPLVIYEAMRRWSPQHFRATLQGYFLPARVIAMAGYWFAKLWVSEFTHYFPISLPVVLPAVFLSRVLNHRLRGDTFLKYVHVGLVGVGVLLAIQALCKVYASPQLEARRRGPRVDAWGGERRQRPLLAKRRLYTLGRVCLH